MAVAVAVPASFSARQSAMDDGSRTSSREGKGRKACGTVQTISAVQAGLAWCACTRCEQLGERATESDASAAASKLLVTLREREGEKRPQGTNPPRSSRRARACPSDPAVRPRTRRRRGQTFTRTAGLPLDGSIGTAKCFKNSRARSAPSAFLCHLYLFIAVLLLCLCNVSLQPSIWEE